MSYIHNLEGSPWRLYAHHHDYHRLPIVPAAASTCLQKLPPLALILHAPEWSHILTILEVLVPVVVSNSSASEVVVVVVGRGAGLSHARCCFIALENREHSIDISTQLLENVGL